MRRANLEVTYQPKKGMKFGQSSTPTEAWWRVVNRGPAVARRVQLEIVAASDVQKEQDVRLMGQETATAARELGDLNPHLEKSVRVTPASLESYPVRVLLSWIDDNGRQSEQYSIEYWQSP